MNKSMKTNKKIIDSYISELYQFENAEAFQKYFRDLPRSGFVPDYVAIDGVLYTMDNYDMKGVEMSYGNKRTGFGFTVTTSDRYKLGMFDAEVETPYMQGVTRNDIYYAD